MTDWDDYRFFLAVAETGTLSAAGRRLGISQPTVGRRIEALESRLNARLFDRSSNGYSLTSAGESICVLAEKMEREALVIERQVGDEQAQLTGRVRIATTEGMATFWLAPRLADLKRLYPKILIELHAGTLPVDLLRREADIALRIGGKKSDELVGKLVGRASCGLYASESYLKAHGEPRSFADLSGHLVIDSTREMTELPQVRRLREVAGQAEVGLRCDNLVAQIAAARAGGGLLPLPAYMLAAAPDLRRVLPEAFDVKLELWLLRHRETKRTLRIRAIMDFLGEAIARDFTGLPADGGTGAG